ncbi:hypothetical protein C8R45DRAFT_1095073 [Mycena sanguinolenta]|nr:hypothetical protein C8R45DRAFT_1095073 [Mycena sanguinolenta]
MAMCLVLSFVIPYRTTDATQLPHHSATQLPHHSATSQAPVFVRATPMAMCLVLSFVIPYRTTDATQLPHHSATSQIAALQTITLLHTGGRHFRISNPLRPTGT